jgi:hypothetical protein
MFQELWRSFRQEIGTWMAEPRARDLDTRGHLGTRYSTVIHSLFSVPFIYSVFLAQFVLYSTEHGRPRHSLQAFYANKYADQRAHEIAF